MRSACSNTSAAAGYWRTRSAPIPTCCEPWPGKTRAVLDQSIIADSLYPARARAIRRRRLFGLLDDQNLLPVVITAGRANPVGRFVLTAVIAGHEMVQAQLVM